jgi:hypothetical protein
MFDNPSERSVKSYYTPTEKHKEREYKSRYSQFYDPSKAVMRVESSISKVKFNDEHFHQDD